MKKQPATLELAMLPEVHVELRRAVAIILAQLVELTLLVEGCGVPFLTADESPKRQILRIFVGSERAAEAELKQDSESDQPSNEQ